MTFAFQHPFAQYIAPEIGATLSYPIPLANTYKFENYTKPNIGANLHIPFHKHFHFSGGLFYNVNSVSMVNELEKISGTVNVITLKYLRIPLSINYDHSIGYGDISLQTGLYVGYVLSGNHEKITRNLTIDQEIINTKTTRLEKGNKNNELYPFDTGLNMAVSYKFPFGLFAKAQYNIGFNALVINELGSFRNQFVNVGLGYSIHNEFLT